MKKNIKRMCVYIYIYIYIYESLFCTEKLIQHCRSTTVH